MVELLLKSLIIGFSIAMPVGPIGMLCIKNSLTRGFKIGLAVGLGAAFADSFYGFLAGGGLAFISKFLTNYSTFIKIIGGLILLYLGVIEIKTARKIPNKEAEVKDSGFAKTICSVFLLTLTNPATILSFIGIFASIGGATLTAFEVGIMICGVFFGSLLWWVILSGTVSLIRHKIPDKCMIAIKVFSSLILIGFAVYSFSSIFDL